MWGFNWVDVIILLILASAVYGGIKAGFLRLVFIFTGFFGGLLLAGWAVPRLITPNTTFGTVIDFNLVLGFGAITGILGYNFGERFHLALRSHGNWRIAESAAGIVLSVGSALVIIWLLTAAIGTLPFEGFSNSVNDSFFDKTLYRYFPPIPSVFATLDRIVNPNAPPLVFVKESPNSFLGGEPLPPATTAAINAGKSVVRMTGFGCGNIVGGSGFVVGPNLVATNAHVIAGVKRPIVKYGTQSFVGKPLLFDPNLDFALLRVPRLKAPALKFDNEKQKPGSQIYIPGYPGGNYALLKGTIKNSLTAPGYNIYGLGNVDRSIYEINANIEPGNSGSPVILPNGQVIGIIIAKSKQTNNVGYALTADSLAQYLAKSGQPKNSVGTGVCASS